MKSIFPVKPLMFVDVVIVYNLPYTEVGTVHQFTVHRSAFHSLIPVHRYRDRQTRVYLKTI